MFDVLRGSQVLVRPYEPDDAQQRFEAMEESREHIRKWDPEEAEICRTLQETREWIAHKLSQSEERVSFSNGIWNLHGTRLLGGVGLHPRKPGGWSVPAFTVGYWIRPSAQGFGYVTQAVGLVVNFGLDVLGAERLEIACDPNNLRSMAIPRRLGFKMEGRARNVYRYPDGRLCDEVIWSLTPTDVRPVSHR
jgi:RimJ/RimL family protein N-acetyltransferase